MLGGTDAVQVHWKITLKYKLVPFWLWIESDVFPNQYQLTESMSEFKSKYCIVFDGTRCTSFSMILLFFSNFENHLNNTIASLTI